MDWPVVPKPLRDTVLLPDGEAVLRGVPVTLRGLASTRTLASVPGGRVTVVPEPVE